MHAGVLGGARVASDCMDVACYTEPAKTYVGFCNSPRSSESVDKRIPSADVGIEKLKDGATILAGGLGLFGGPEYLIKAVGRQGPKGPTGRTRDAGADGAGVVRSC